MAQRGRAALPGPHSRGPVGTQARAGDAGVCRGTEGTAGKASKLHVTRGQAAARGGGSSHRPGAWARRKAQRGGSRQVGSFRCESRFCHHCFRLRCHLCAVKSGAGPGVCAPVPSPAEPGDGVPTLGAPPPPCPARFLPPTPRPPVSGSVLAGSCFPVGGDAPVPPPRLLEAVAAGTRPACGECGGSCCPLPPLGTFRRGELASLGGPASESPGG